MMTFNNSIKIFIAVIVVFFCNACQVSKNPSSINRGLLGHFPFHKQANDVLGKSKTKIHGAVLTTNRFKKANSAYFFDGKSHLAIQDLQKLNNLESFAISVWVYPSKINQTHNTILSKYGPNRDFHLKIIQEFGNRFEAHFAHGSRYYRTKSKPLVQLNQWLHVLYQWTGKKWQLFVNGNLASEREYKGKSPLWTGSRLTIGSLGRGEFFTGKIDDIRIYNRALLAKEINQLYLLQE